MRAHLLLALLPPFAPAAAQDPQRPPNTLFVFADGPLSWIDEIRAPLFCEPNPNYDPDKQKKADGGERQRSDGRQ